MTNQTSFWQCAWCGRFVYSERALYKFLLHPYLEIPPRINSQLNYGMCVFRITLCSRGLYKDNISAQCKSAYLQWLWCSYDKLEWQRISVVRQDSTPGSGVLVTVVWQFWPYYVWRLTNKYEPGLFCNSLRTLLGKSKSGPLKYIDVITANNRISTIEIYVLEELVFV